MNPDALTLPLAFGAGLLAFASPCFLPIVPATVTMLASEQGAPVEASRWLAVRRASVFVAAFTAVFCALWLLVAVSGPLVAPWRGPLRIVAGAVIIIVGFHVAGLVHLPLLDRTVRGQIDAAATRPGWLRAGALGLAFGAGWSPCIGPVLGAIIALAASSGSLVRGGVLMVTFCAGMGLPFLAMAAGLSASEHLRRWLARHHRGLALVTGLLLVVTGMLVLTNTLEMISSWLPAYG